MNTMTFYELAYVDFGLTNNIPLTFSDNGKEFMYQREGSIFRIKENTSLQEEIQKKYNVSCTAVFSSRCNNIYWYTLYFPVETGFFVYEVKVYVREKSVLCSCKHSNKENRGSEFVSFSQFPYPSVFASIQTKLKEYIENDPAIRFYFITGDLPTENWNQIHVG